MGVPYVGKYPKFLISVDSLHKHGPLVCCVSGSFNTNMLVQEHKGKIINTKVHKVLMWFGQPCLCPWMTNNHSTIQYR